MGAYMQNPPPPPPSLAAPLVLLLLHLLPLLALLQLLLLSLTLPPLLQLQLRLLLLLLPARGHSPALSFPRWPSRSLAGPLVCSLARWPPHSYVPALCSRSLLSVVTSL